jgi:hypothetical protein
VNIGNLWRALRGPLCVRFLPIVLAAAGASGQTIVVGTDTKTSVTIPPGFFGYSDESDANINRQDPNCLAAISKIQTRVVRFPGGETGNYWDWQTGLPLTNYDSGLMVFKTLYPRTPANLQQQMALMHSTPIYMLNMLSDPQCKPPAGGLCQYTPSSPNLNYQLQWLQSAQALGLPVKYVELGNEYYVSTLAGYTQVYPDPVTSSDPLAATVYARLATQWIAAIKKQFPQALVAAIGATSTDNSSGGARRTSWNAGLFPALVGADAITLHTYIRTALPKGTTVFDDTAAQYMLGTPFSNWATLQKDMAQLPANIPIWVTEYDLGDYNYPVWGTWADALLNATMTMLYLEQPRVQIAAKYSLLENGIHAAIFSSTSGFTEGGNGFTDPPNPPKSTLWGQTASAITLQEIAAASLSATQAVSLTFPGAATLSGGGTSYPALYGWNFQSGTARSMVVLNLSNQSLTVDVSGLGLSGAAYDQISGAPFTYVTGGLSGSPSNLTENNGNLAGKPCALPAYSITRIFTATPASHQPAKGRERRRP